MEAMAARITALCILAGLLPSVRAEEKPFREFFKEEGRIWTSPARINKKHLPWLVALGAGTAGLIAADTGISNRLSNGPAELRWGGRISRFGSSYGLAGLSGGILAAGTVSGDRKLQRTGAAALEAATHALAVNYALKWATARERPHTGSGNGQFFSAYDGRAFKSNTSFPSGHSMGSWAVATVIAQRYKNRRWVPWVAYGFASSVSAARVAGGKHYVSDVAVGAVAGYLIGRLVAHKHDRDAGVVSESREAPLVPSALRRDSSGDTKTEPVPAQASPAP